MEQKPNISFIKRYWLIGFIIVIIIVTIFILVSYIINKNKKTTGITSNGEFECPSKVIYKDNISYATYPEGEKQITEDMVKEVRNHCSHAEIIEEKTEDSNPTPTKTKSKFDVYPQTSEAPVLHMYWGEEKTAEIPLDEVQSIGRFGLWEGMGSMYKAGMEPASEIEIHITNKKQPIYAFVSGTITQLKVDDDKAEIAVRYGTNYAMKYSVVDYNKNLKENSKVESGDFLGYTSWYEANNQPSYGFFEFEFNVKINDAVRAIPPIDYFDAESKASLEKIPTKFGFSGWIADPNNKDEGWIAYVGKPEAWATGIVFDIPGDDLKEYWNKFGLDFIYK